MGQKNNNSLYQDAVLDALKVKEVAIKEAQHNVLEAITPRIREFVEQEILHPTEDFGDDIECIDDVECDNQVGTTISTVQNPTQPISPQQIVNVEVEKPLDTTLAPLMTAIKSNDAIGAASAIIDLLRNTSRLNATIPQLKETKTFKHKVASLIDGIDHAYAYTQEAVTDVQFKQKISEQLEIAARDLKKIHEDIMKNTKNRKHLFEDEQTNQSSDQGAESKKKVSLNIDVPSDLADDLVTALGDIEISLEDEQGDIEDSELELSDDDNGESLEVDTDEENASPENVDVDDNDEQLQLNSRKLSDDTIVEIDEGMLRAELKRLKEGSGKFAVPTTKGAGPGDTLDDFGGAVDEDEPLEIDVTTEAVDVSTVQGVATKGDDDEEVLCDDEAKCEALKRRLQKESRIQQIAKLNSRRLQKEGIVARKTRDVKRYNAAKESFLKEVKTYNESITRSRKLQSSLNEAKQGKRSNSAPMANSLRRKLAESNLDNVKLQYANKLLRSSALTNNDKLKIVEQLETAQSISEAKVIYESSVRLLASKPQRKVVTESTGSASRATMSGAPKQTLSEGVELDRWAQLAGIK